MTREKLDPEAISRGLETLEGWELKPEGGAISRSFRFRNFSEAFGFMTECAFTAEKLNHHPEWLNVYSRIDVVLSTHDAEGLTELDFKLARAMDKAAARRN
jgi:4a-hydroxytetrahydrobiopterin dehydratase